jgi:hypothetical protein
MERTQSAQSSAIDEIWDVNPQGELLGTYITNPDSSFNHDGVTVDTPHLLYQSSERSKESLWNDIKKNEWHYLTLYVSNF